MANGFEGLEINKNGKIQVINPTFGFNGLEMNLKKQLYLSPSFGFLGIEFNLNDAPQPINLKVEKK
jgi:hypothetical protein